MNNLREFFDRKRTAADYIEQTQHRKMNIECIKKIKTKNGMQDTLDQHTYTD
jgi:hypothetical protein